MHIRVMFGPNVGKYSSTPNKYLGFFSTLPSSTSNLSMLELTSSQVPAEMEPLSYVPTWTCGLSLLPETLDPKEGESAGAGVRLQFHQFRYSTPEIYLT